MILKKACEVAGVEYLTPHEPGRHTFATWKRRYAGLDLKGLAMAGKPAVLVEGGNAIDRQPDHAAI